MKAPEIDFRGTTDEVKRLSAERNKDVRIIELLEANNALVMKLRDFRRRWRGQAGTIYLHGLIMGGMCGVIAMGVAMTYIVNWGCRP